jgi:hypothetical protein
MMAPLRASARAFPNRFDCEGPNSTVKRRSIQTTLTEAWADRRATRAPAYGLPRYRVAVPRLNRDRGTSRLVRNATVVTNPGSVSVGQKVGTVANWHQWGCGIPDHVHLGATGPASDIKAVFAAPQIEQ